LQSRHGERNREIKKGIRHVFRDMPGGWRDGATHHLATTIHRIPLHSPSSAPPTLPDRSLDQTHRALGDSPLVCYPTAYATPSRYRRAVPQPLAPPSESQLENGAMPLVRNAGRACGPSDPGPPKPHTKARHIGHRPFGIGAASAKPAGLPAALAQVARSRSTAAGDDWARPSAQTCSAGRHPSTTQPEIGTSSRTPGHCRPEPSSAHSYSACPAVAESAQRRDPAA